MSFDEGIQNGGNELPKVEVPSTRPHGSSARSFADHVPRRFVVDDRGWCRSGRG